MNKLSIIIFTILITTIPMLAIAGGGGGGGGTGSSAPTLNIALQILFPIVVAFLYRKKK